MFPSLAVDVQAFGARGDGTPSQGQYFNDAINHVSCRGGGTVWVPGGTYAISGVRSDRIIARQNTRIVFEPGCVIETGMRTDHAQVITISTFRDSKPDGVDPETNAIDLTMRPTDPKTNGVTDARNIVIEGNGLQIIGDRTAVPNPTNPSQMLLSIGIRIDVGDDGGACSNIRVTNVHLSGFYTDAVSIAGKDAQRSPTDIVIDRCTTDGCGHNGVGVTGARRVLFTDCVFSNTGPERPAAGVDCEPNKDGFVQDITFVRCQFLNNRELGLYVQNGVGNGEGNQGGREVGAERIRAVDCLFQGNGVLGCNFNSGRGLSATGCQAVANGEFGFNGGHQYIGCSAVGNGKDGFRTLAVGDVSLLNCTGRDNGLSGFMVHRMAEGTGESSLVGCRALNNGFAGIHLTSVSDATVQGCTVTGNQQDGIKMSGADNCRIELNVVGWNGQVKDNSADNIVLEGGSRQNKLINNTVRQSRNFFEGTVTAATATTVTLPASADGSDDSYTGMTLRIISRAGDEQAAVITDYEGSTRIVTLGGFLRPPPDAASTVSITGAAFFHGNTEAGTKDTVTLPEAQAADSDDFYQGMTLWLLDGPDAGQPRTITDYTASTRVVTVDTPFMTPPVTSKVWITRAIRPRYGIFVAHGSIDNSITDNDIRNGGAKGELNPGIAAAV